MPSASVFLIEGDSALAASSSPPYLLHDNAMAERRQLRTLIEDIVAGVFGVTPEQLRQPTRGQARIALARQVAMYIAHVGFSMTLTEVGELFERDRTTVAHACGVVESRRDDVQFDAGVVLLEHIIRVVNVPKAAGPVLPEAIADAMT